MVDVWRCPSTAGPGDCLNPMPHHEPRGCYHQASWAPDRHDRNEGTDEE